MKLHSNPFIIKPSKTISRQFSKLKDKEEKTLKAFGSKLWSALDIDKGFAEHEESSGREILPIVIESDDTGILKLPWELLYHPKFGFLAKNSRFTLSRSLSKTPRLDNLPNKTPLRVLLFSTLPDELEGSGRLAVEKEQVAVLESLLPSIKKGWVKLLMPNDGRFESLGRYIETFKPHLLFLSGHGDYKDGKGYFLFENKRGFKKLIDEENFTKAFNGSTVECVVLSSCKSAKTDSDNLNNGLTRALAFEGIKNVIGMSDSIYDKAGIRFTKEFMRMLSEKNAIAIASQKAREEVFKLEGEVSSHWFLPLLISENVSNFLVDWDFTPQIPSREITNRKLNQITFPELFIGRRYEFRKFYNYLYGNTLKKLLIYGEGGIGKSALAGKFGLELRHEGYKVFDYSLKHGDDFDSFLMDVEFSLSKDRQEVYRQIKERCKDEQCRAKRLIGLLLEENANGKVAFIFDNLESVQNPTDKKVEDETIKIWIEVLDKFDDVVLLITSRWLVSDCQHIIQLGKPSWSDFLHYISLQNIDFSDKRIIKDVYDTLGGNYRGAEYFISAVKKMQSRMEEENFLKELSTAKRDLQVNMAIEKILSFRSPEEIELLHRLSVYPVPVPKEGVRKISRDLPKDSIDILVSFSLVTKSTNGEYMVDEYQISPLVLDFIRKDIELSDELKVWASDYQVYLLEQERDTLHQAIIAHEALKFANRIGEADRLALDRITGELNRAGRYKTLLEDWLPDIAESEDDAIRADALNQIGFQHYCLAEYRKALRCYEQSLKIAVEIGDKEGEGGTLHDIGQIYFSIGDLDKALEYFEKSLKIAIEIGGNSDETALDGMAQVYLSRGDLDKALKYLEKSLKIAIARKHKGGEGAILNIMAPIYISRGDSEKALEYLEKSLKIAAETGCKACEGGTLNNMARIYRDREDLKKALEYLEKSLKIAVEIGDKEGEGGTLNNMARIYRSMGELDKALEYCEKSLKIAIEIENKINGGSVLEYMARIYEDKGDLEKALVHYEQSLKISEEIKRIFVKRA